MEDTIKVFTVYDDDGMVVVKGKWYGIDR